MGESQNLLQGMFVGKEAGLAQANAVMNHCFEFAVDPNAVGVLNKAQAKLEVRCPQNCRLPPQVLIHAPHEQQDQLCVAIVSAPRIFGQMAAMQKGAGPQITPLNDT